MNFVQIIKKIDLIYILLMTVIYLITILSLVLIFLVLSYDRLGFGVSPFKVIGASMNPTFENKQIVIGYKYPDMKINYNDVVMIDNRNGSLDEIAKKDKSCSIIKRIVAVPGDTVFYENGYIYVNGEINDDFAFIPGGKLNYYLSIESFEITLGDDEYFVLGDNKGNSADSRKFGTVTKDEIIAKAVEWKR